jgi:hypothetical protein
LLELGKPVLSSRKKLLPLMVKEGRAEEMVRRATPETIERAILIWITLLGMMGNDCITAAPELI